jgi:hypothetical protein
MTKLEVNRDLLHPVGRNGRVKPDTSGLEIVENIRSGENHLSLVIRSLELMKR